MPTPNPVAYVRKMAREAGISLPRAERIWEHAKDAARAYGRPGTDRYWAAVTGIFRNIVTGKVSQNPPAFNAAFWKWFGDSVVRHPDGSPMVVYHGTMARFTKFNTSQSEMGAHFGTIEQAEMGHLHGSIIPCFLRIESPLRLVDTGDFAPVHVISQLRDMGMISDKDADPELFENKDLQRALEDVGYDGIVYLNRREGYGGSAETWAEAVLEPEMSDRKWLKRHPTAADSWIAFHPYQIKSVYNAGTWDPRDPDIRRNR